MTRRALLALCLSLVPSAASAQRVRLRFRPIEPLTNFIDEDGATLFIDEDGAVSFTDEDGA